ncbi:hypothetical protein [Rubripirellula obstinata]|nr:hypothetical protein [Rubripirellula obstinata]
MAIGIVISLMVSCTLLIWAFSLPFARLSASARPAATEVDVEISSKQQRTEAQEIRAAAIAQHRDFLYLLKKQKQVKSQKELPGREQAEERWNRRTEAIKVKIVELDQAIKDNDIPEGSVLWENRQRLIEISSDSAE